MRTLAAVCKDNPERANIIRAVVRRIGKDSIMDVVNHGVDGGFSGFIYYKDTCAFYAKYRKTINAWLIEMARELGEDPIECVAGFGCIKADKNDTEIRQTIGRCLYDGRLGENTENIENALAWFAAEESCRLFDD